VWVAESLSPVRGLDVIRRGVYEIDHSGHEFAVEVDYLDFSEKIRLYRDGTWVETRKSPARFQIEDGAVIEASMGLLGMRKLRLVGAEGETPLRPAPGTAEARRVSFERRHPTASRLIGVASWAILVAAVVLEIPQLVDLVADKLGFEFDSPLLLPSPVNTLVGVLALLAALERALRFKHNRWLD
jgi:hypothetical protein